ncbi:MAG: NADH-quinone oxidoreductase subunit A [Fimbriimonadaceae bacterium]|nr:NADH-quinone oxidoreductase subunit A [Fimbriimonadaceae bacterium]
MFGEFLPILLLMLVAAVVAGAMVTLSWVLGPKKDTPYKSSTYECGVTPVGNAIERFPIKFYLVAILFVLFDIEVVFLWSWITVFKGATIQYQVFSGVAVGIYLVLWIIGDAYVIKVGALEWDEEPQVAPEKLLPTPVEAPTIAAGSHS